MTLGGEQTSLGTSDPDQGLAPDLALKVREIIARQAGVEAESLSLDASLSGLGLDSLGMVEMIFALEESFAISVPFNANDPALEGFDVTSVGAVIEGVERLVAGRAA